jgi:hypothetical protein
MVGEEQQGTQGIAKDCFKQETAEYIFLLY